MSKASPAAVAMNVRATNAFRREAELWIALGHHPHIVAARTYRIRHYGKKQGEGPIRVEGE